METTLLLPHGTLRALPACRKPARETNSGLLRWSYKPKYSSLVVAVMVRPKETSRGTMAVAVAVAVTEEEEKKKVYRDNWFDRLAIRYLSKSIQETTGIRNEKDGYESLIEVASVVSRSFDAKRQREVVIQSLRNAFPSFMLTMIKILLPPSKFSKEYFAAFTTMFFSWLVGPCEGIRISGKNREECGLYSQVQVLGEHQLCGDVHKHVQDPMPKVHTGLPWYACQHGSKFRRHEL